MGLPPVGYAKEARPFGEEGCDGGSMARRPYFNFLKQMLHENGYGVEHPVFESRFLDQHLLKEA